VLSDVLRTVRLTGALFFLVDASSPWVEELPAAESFGPVLLPGAQQIVSYHVVTRGPCWGALVGGPAVRLETGDIFLVPHGDAYALSSAPGMRGESSREDAQAFFRRMAAGELPFLLAEGGGGPDRYGVICGFLGCDVRPFNPVLAALPRLVHVRRLKQDKDRLGPLIEFALAEARESRSGGQCVLVRLSELMFIEAVRRYLTGLPAEETGWLAGLRDPVVGTALSLLHARPAHPWTLETLAKQAALSRTVLADRFTHLVGQPPMRYLTHWRMQLAAKRLADGTAKVSRVALEVGYDSEAAFSRAFKRIVGASPAAWRRRTTSGPAAPRG
jgi:AraC-like DNA-binding protein